MFVDAPMLQIPTISPAIAIETAIFKTPSPIKLVLDIGSIPGSYRMPNKIEIFFVPPTFKSRQSYNFEYDTVIFFKFERIDFSRSFEYTAR